jgi:hypothetical protein
LFVMKQKILDDMIRSFKNKQNARSVWFTKKGIP